MALIDEMLRRMKKKHGLATPPAGFDPSPGHTAAVADHAGAVAAYNAGLPAMWQNLINSDPILGQDLANLLGERIGDRASVQGALRSALVRYGGADALRGIMGNLGSQPGFEDLIDETTIGAAGAADKAGTSIVAQLEKAHRDRLLAEEDIRAAKGILSSGQSGYEIGEARQAHTINRSDSVNQLLDFLRGGLGDFASRERQRNAQESAARAAAAARVADLGLEPPPPPPPPQPAPYTSPQMMQQLIRNSKRPARRPLRSEDTGW